MKLVNRILIDVVPSILLLFNLCEFRRAIKHIVIDYEIHISPVSHEQHIHHTVSVNVGEFENLVVWDVRNIVVLHKAERVEAVCFLLIFGYAIYPLLSSDIDLVVFFVWSILLLNCQE